MSIFKINNSKLTPIKETSLSLEKDLQKITEDNLETIFGLDFVSSEFSLHQFRIDTLTFDKETKSFVIIEYKRDKSFSVIDQGYAYLALMLNNKADFILEYNEKKKENLRREDVDWSQSRVLFLANSFTPYQQNAINFKDLPIELWEVKKYDNQTILYNQLKSTDVKESIKTVSKSKTIESVSREVKKYSIDDHFKVGWENTRELFEEIRSKILDIDTRIEEKVNKYYIGYKIGAFNICAIHAYKSKLELHLVRVDKEDLKDPDNKIIKIPWEERGWGKLCGYQINTSSDIDYALFLIKQVYEKFYK
jgi:predicted transport protein